MTGDFSNEIRAARTTDLLTDKDSLPRISYCVTAYGCCRISRRRGGGNQFFRLISENLCTALLHCRLRFPQTPVLRIFTGDSRGRFGFVRASLANGTRARVKLYFLLYRVLVHYCARWWMRYRTGKKKKRLLVVFHQAHSSFSIYYVARSVR